MEADLRTLPILSSGASSIVYQLPNSTVLKVPRNLQDDLKAIVVEKLIYERLGPHPLIPVIHTAGDQHICLERLQCTLRMRLAQLSSANHLSPLDVLRLAEQIAKALAFVHSRQVLQVDIGCHNVLLTFDDDAKLSDFAGSSLDDSEPLIDPGLNSTNPLLPIPSVAAEIFALGSLFYELETTKLPLYSKTRKEVEQLFIAKRFPDTDSLLLGNIISKCWNGRFSNVQEIVHSLNRLNYTPPVPYSSQLREMLWSLYRWVIS